MGRRTVSAVIGAALLLGLTYLGGAYTLVLALTISLFALHEFMRIGERLGHRAWFKADALEVMLWLLGVFLYGRAGLGPGFVFSLLVAGGRFALNYPKTNLAEALYNLLAVTYTAGLMSYLLLLRGLPEPWGIKWTFVTFFLVWASDTGAYLIGKVLGRHPLAPAVSPNKTVEGSVGGLLFSLGAGFALRPWLAGVPAGFLLGLALSVGIGAQIGDLFESALKRAAGVKDSGRTIPGHGGFLDRFDSFVFVLPLVYYLVSCLQ
ncbi:phosphatidate cytidylyltransferase [Acididesulfobacillus acetoxydans]|uniref:Phosphatidate cytidylyltransferase n=1 Tax=Acididesulfobacillus acetoxydans TaxID=1561005 RepID=A0A8S0W9F4_9FIRM|nr:phosphatidate cytidylyltransferase [Acididesulfobacillus acetoxydans]CAA7602549.1 phosphatidate cytidylyltransferase [Acididesulfobacillus acetoxydans]CEJ07305.1 Phosphatidate cytidylyltransferase [Acididesulfobacillus acetoxydans]